MLLPLSGVHRATAAVLSVLAFAAMSISTGCTKARVANAEGQGMRSPSMTEQLRDRPFQPEHSAAVTSSPMFNPR